MKLTTEQTLALRVLNNAIGTSLMDLYHMADPAPRGVTEAQVQNVLSTAIANTESLLAALKELENPTDHEVEDYAACVEKPSPLR